MAVAVAMAALPGLLLADEPTSQLDHQHRDEVLDALHSINSGVGTTVLTVTHDPEVAARMPRRITIRDGRVGSEGVGTEEFAVIGRDGSLQLPPDILEQIPTGSLLRVRLLPSGEVLLGRAEQDGAEAGRPRRGERRMTSGGRHRADGAPNPARAPWPPRAAPTARARASAPAELTVRFGDVTAVQNVSLQVRAGELVAVTGPSGAGKTSLLGALAGVYPPAAGVVSLDGEPIRDRDDATGRDIVLIPQGNALVSVLTAQENAAAAAAQPQAARRGARPPSPHSTPSGWARPWASWWRNCPAASSSGSRWPAGWPSAERSCWPTSRPASSTASTAPTSCGCCGPRRSAGRRSLVATHDPEAADGLRRRAAPGRGLRRVGARRPRPGGRVRARRRRPHRKTEGSR